MRLLLATILFFAGTAHALADPTGGFLTYGVISFLAADLDLGVIAATTLAPYVLGAVGIGLSIGLQTLLTPHPNGPQGVDPGKMKETFQTADSPEIRAVGRVRVGGTKVFGNTHDTNRYRLVAHCKGEIDGIEAYYIGGREVVVDDNGAVSSPPWPRSGGGSWAILQSKVGDGLETSWPQLQADFPDLWTADHRVRGIAQTLVEYISPGLGSQKFLQLYQSGAPDIEILLRPDKLVFDSRNDAMAWTENGICNALHILRSYPELNDIALYDQTFLSSEADRADVSTLRKSGLSTARARCSGFWSSENNRGDTMQQVLDSIGAMIVPRLGSVVNEIQEVTLGIQLMDDAPLAEHTLPAKHLLDLKWFAGPQGVERPNVCRVKYYAPERNYELTEIDLTGIAWARIEDEITAYGEKPYDVTLPFCPDSGQAQQIARRKFDLARADSGLATYNMAGLAAWGCRIINIEFPDDAGLSLCYVGVPRVDDKEGQVEIPFVICPTLTPWNPDVDEAAAPDQLPDFQAESVLTQPSAPTDAYVIYDAGGSVVRSGTDYKIPADGAQVEATYRVYTSGNPGPWLSMTESGTAGGPGFAEVLTSLLGTISDFRLRTFDATGDNASYWSSLLNAAVTAAVAYADLAAPVLALDGSNNLIATAPAAAGNIKSRFNGGAWTSHVVASGASATIATNPVPAGLYEAQFFPTVGYGGYGTRIASYTAP